MREIMESVCMKESIDLSSTQRAFDFKFGIDIELENIMILLSRDIGPVLDTGFMEDVSAFDFS